VARFGIDIWMTTTAIANGFKVAQSFLGAKIHDAKDPGTDLGNMLYQVVSSTFQLMENYAEVWTPVRGSQPVPTFGFEYTVGLEHVNVNTARMLALFREGLLNLREIWLGILGAGDLKEVERLGEMEDAKFHFPRRYGHASSTTTPLRFIRSGCRRSICSNRYCRCISARPFRLCCRSGPWRRTKRRRRLTSCVWNLSTARIFCVPVGNKPVLRR